jgi:hypothetical protein
MRIMKEKEMCLTAICEGETRHKRRFLFFPKTLSGETRWFEFATWREEYQAKFEASSVCGTGPVIRYRWVPVGWAW